MWPARPNHERRQMEYATCVWLDRKRMVLGEEMYLMRIFHWTPYGGTPLKLLNPGMKNQRFSTTHCLIGPGLSQFFATDTWHNLHLGAGKHWVAHAFVSAIEKLTFWPEISVESRFEFLTTKFKEYCREHHISPFMDEISRASMGYLSSSACPVGQWSKGIITTHMMKFVEHFCNEYVVGKDWGSNYVSNCFLTCDWQALVCLSHLFHCVGKRFAYISSLR